MSALFDASIKILKFSLQEVPLYHEQYVRPYQANAENSIIEEIGRRIDVNQNIQNTTFAGIAGRFLAPSAIPSQQVQIVNGWRQRRYRWVLEAEVTSRSGSVNKHFLTGYTDHNGVQAVNGAPYAVNEMIFYINNSARFRYVNVPTPTGIQQQLVPATNDQVIANNAYSGLDHANQHTLSRPYDVVQHMAVAQHTADLVSSELVLSDTVSTSRAVKSRRQNANPTTFMAHSMNAFRTAQLETAGYGRHNTDEMYEKALSVCREGAPEDDPLMGLIRNIRQDSLSGNFFSMGDLRRIDPMIDQKLQFKQIKQAIRTSTNVISDQKTFDGWQGTDTQTWHAATNETHVATKIATMLPSLMSDCNLAGVVFNATNMFGAGVTGGIAPFVISFSGGMPMVPGDHTQLLQLLQARLNLELLYDVTNGGTDTIDLAVSCSLSGDTRIRMTLNGSYSEYMYPNFSDGLNSPVLSGAVGNAMQIAQGFDNLVSYRFQQMQQYHTPEHMAQDGVVNFNSNNVNF